VFLTETRVVADVLLLISHNCSNPPYCFHLDPPSLSFLSTTLPSSQEHKVKSSSSISPCHQHEFTLCATYAEHSINIVQHTPSTAYTYDHLSSLHSHNFKLTSKWSCSIWHTSLPIDRHRPVLHQSFKVKVTSSHSRVFVLTTR